MCHELCPGLAPGLLCFATRGFFTVEKGHVGRHPSPSWDLLSPSLRFPAPMPSLVTSPQGPSCPKGPLPAPDVPKLHPSTLYIRGWGTQCKAAPPEAPVSQDLVRV